MNRLQVLAVASLALLSGLAPQLCAQDFEALAKDVAQELAGRQYDKVEARFDATMASAMPLEKLRSVWEATAAQVGALKTVKSARSAEMQGYHVVTLACDFEKSPLNLRLVFDKDGKVAGFFIVPPAAAGILPTTLTRALSTRSTLRLAPSRGNCRARSPSRSARDRSPPSCWCRGQARTMRTRPLGRTSPLRTWPGAWPAAVSSCCGTRKEPTNTLRSIRRRWGT